MKPADDDFFWFITFLIDEEDSTPKDVREALQLPTIQATQNLWCCRRCGAMVHGGQRHTHKNFHQRLRAAGIE